MRSYIDRHWIAITSLILLVYCLLISLQGIDLRDEGYVLVAYQNFFDDHTYANHMNGMYLTALIGGVWEKIFGAYGWYSFRVFSSIIIVFGYIITCYTLKEYWKYKIWIFLGFFLAVLYQIYKHSILVFHYDILSAFMNCLIAYLLFRSYKESNIKYLFSASILLGLDIFVRLPNIMLCAIPFILTLISLFYKKDRTAFVRQLGVINTGLIIGITLSILIILALGHWDYYLNSLGNYSNTAQQSNSSHSIIQMMKTYSENYAFVVLYISIILFCFLCISVLSKIELLKRHPIPYCTFVACGIIVVCRLLYTSTLPRYAPISLLLSFVYVLLLYVLVKQRHDKNVVILILIFFLISILQPIGSDYGIGNMGPYSIWGLISTTLVLFANQQKIKRESFHCNPYLWAVGAFMFFISISLLKANLQYCFNDEGPRIAKRYKIASLPKANVYTSKELAGEIDSVLHVCKDKIKEGDTILFALDLPAMHYLTHTKPLINTPWPEVLPSGKIDLLLKEKENKPPKLIVRRTYPIMNIPKRKDYSGISNHDRDRIVHNNKVLDNYIDKIGYHVVWGNGHYSVYVK